MARQAGVNVAVQTEQLHRLAQQIRVDSIRASTAAGSGHPTSSLSAADLLAVLMTRHLRYDFGHPEHPDNDHLIFSKGHASPLLYAVFKAAGVISDAELLTFRKLGSRLQGHPTPAIPWVDVATGSLGQGLPIGVGIALAGKYLEKRGYRVWILCGDSEMAEGSIWEAFDKASYYKLNNLIAILDMNRLGQRGPTELGWDGEAYARRAEAFGWHAQMIDGHDIGEIDGALTEAVQPRDRPTVIIARTIKGRGVSFLEDKEGWHGKPLNADQAKQAIAELGGENATTVTVAKPDGPAFAPVAADGPVDLPAYKPGDVVATRKAYGDALKALGASRPRVVALDGEVNNSTYAEEFARAYPERYFEMFIAEQQMVAAAVGLSARKFVPFASTFAAFLTRACDFIRMAAISQANIRLCGSHAGVSIGEDGPSQMGLEDLAMMRAVHGSTVLYPCDANQTARLVVTMADQGGISFVRATRMGTPVIYEASEEFPIGGSKILRRSANDQVTVVAAGITVHEALKAHDALLAEGVAIRVIDAYSVKPLDRAAIDEAVRGTLGRLLIVEDHWPEGGLGSAVLESLSAGGQPSPVLRFKHLAVRDMPESGKPQELLHAAGIDAGAITAAVRGLLTLA